LAAAAAEPISATLEMEVVAAAAPLATRQALEAQGMGVATVLPMLLVVAAVWVE